MVVCLVRTRTTPYLEIRLLIIRTMHDMRSRATFYVRPGAQGTSQLPTGLKLARRFVLLTDDSATRTFDLTGRKQ